MSAEGGGRTRALFKKGQKCIHPIEEVNEDGTSEVIKYPAVIERGEKRHDEDTGESAYWYLLSYPGYGESHNAWVEEYELLRYDATLLSKGTSAEADAALALAEEMAEAKRRKERLGEIPVQLRIRIPAHIKRILLEDHDAVTQRGMALALPRPARGRPSVADVLAMWEATRKEDEDEETCAMVDEVLAGLASYFDNALRHFLLYQAELPACDAALGGGAFDPKDVYGAEHLLRLIAKLPELVPVVQMTGGGASAQYVVSLEDEIEDLMAWLTNVEHKEAVFAKAEEYERNPHWTGPPVAAAAGAGGPGGGGRGGGRGRGRGKGRGCVRGRGEEAAAVAVEGAAPAEAAPAEAAPS
jgi:hypothetical protein